MKKLQLIEEVTENGTEWVLSITDNNPESKDCFTLKSSNEAIRVKELLEKWSNN